MSEVHEDSTSGKKMKKLEKLQASTNREYLDMDTDEEEFGKQETPEPEEELEIEPEKPVFTGEELNILVQYIKDLTTLPSLTEADWSPEVVEVVEEYFQSPANTVLTVFWKARTLKALFEFPFGIDRGLTYFLRAPWQIYTPDNFLSTVMFGSVNGRVDNSMLKFMESIYAPIAFRSEEWPTVVKNELFSNLHEFLLNLTDVTYKPMGLTILYVPREGLKEDRNLLEIKDEPNSSLEINHKSIKIKPRDEEEEDLIERLERVARYWIKQIREALKGTSSCIFPSPWKTIVDEIRYWHYRYENLSCVYQQLTNESVLSIVKKLECVRSASVKHWNPLMSEVQGMLDEATSNIKYLNLLEEFSKGFEIPDGVDDYATRILLLVRFIGTESPFYNTRERIENLCKAFCVQAVKHCCEFIDLDIVLDGDPGAARTMLIKCIESCDKLSNAYDRLADMDKISELPTISLADKSKAFNHVDTLVNRCNDLILIADARIAFDKCDEPVIIYGPKRLELGLHYRNIEKRFNMILDEIKNARDIILDIVSGAWLKRIVAFKQDLKDIENMVKNWIDDIFQNVLNVEEGIEALHGIVRFSRRPYLWETLYTKWIHIWKIFGIELENYSVETKRDSILHHPSLPPFSGQANILRSNKIYLTRQHRMLIDASDWFGDCDVQAAVTRKYKCILAAITEKEAELFVKWQNEIAEKKIDPTVISNQPIIKYHTNTKVRTIAVNLQMFYIDHIREIGEWTLLNYDTNNIFSNDCPKWETLQSRYNKVEYLCKMYNSIVANLTNRKTFLFSIPLNDAEEIMCSGFKITWSSDSFERFFTDCTETIIKIQESIEVCRSTDWKVDYFIERIAVTSLVNPVNGLLKELKDCETYLEQEKCHGLSFISKNLKKVLKLLLELKSKINTDEEQTAEHWNEYIERIYEKLTNSFTNCMRLSLLCVLQLLRDDESETNINAASSKVQQAEWAITRINASALKEALTIEEFSELFDARNQDRITIFLDSIDQDPRSIDLRKDINDILNINRMRIQ